VRLGGPRPAAGHVSEPTTRQAKPGAPRSGLARLQGWAAGQHSLRPPVGKRCAEASPQEAHSRAATESKRIATTAAMSRPQVLGTMSRGTAVGAVYRPTFGRRLPDLLGAQGSARAEAPCPPRAPDPHAGPGH